jgi:hypothetical protein
MHTRSSSPQDVLALHPSHSTSPHGKRSVDTTIQVRVELPISRTRSVSMRWRLSKMLIEYRRSTMKRATSAAMICMPPRSPPRSFILPRASNRICLRLPRHASRFEMDAPLLPHGRNMPRSAFHLPSSVPNVVLNFIVQWGRRIVSRGRCRKNWTTGFRR